MKNPIAVIIPDERMRSVVETIIKTDFSLQLLGAYSNTVDAIQNLEKIKDVVVIFGLGGNGQLSLRNSRSPLAVT